jgi:hypothetical protein
METTMRQSVSDVEKLVAINEIREVMASYARPKSLPSGFINRLQGSLKDT